MPKPVCQRTCIGCRTKKAKDQLVRMVINAKGNLVFDQGEKTQGRGAYLCRLKGFKVNQKCLEQAIKRRAFKYAFKKEIKSIKIPLSGVKISSAPHCNNNGPC